MKFSIATAAATSAQRPADAWVCFVAEGGKAGVPAIESLVADLVKSGDFKARKGSGVALFAPAGAPARRLVVAGLGAPADAGSAKAFKAAATKAAQLLLDGASASADVWLPDAPADAVMSMVLALRECAYRYGTTKSKKPDPVSLAEVRLVVGDKQAASAKAALKRAVGLADGIELARELGNLPGNHCTPSHLASVARALGKDKSIKTQVLDRKQIEALGMGSFLSVTHGSAEPPRFIVLRYQGAAAKDKPHVLVGKGITFDTGGISLKPAAEMDEMKFDMGGAASVLGTFKALAAIKPALNVVGLIPTCENMPSGTATKPGDVVTSMSGQTIEVLNTDAEGRLILCDALTYAERFEPKSVVDIATLTGACVIALGHVNSGLFTQDDALADALLKAGRDALDPCWRMPLEEEYDEALKSNFADVANVGGRAGGSITAARFLHRFAGKFRWAHLDIAGTAWKSGAAKGATGRPVGLLVHYLLAQAG
ncbi:MAG: leucyl aminopeptidase [Betaproteobacteria bacterium]|nr:leucyl aminopeptidase [Betaproteobacteria bacterium]